MNSGKEITKLLTDVLRTDFNIKKCEYSDEKLEGGYVSRMISVKVFAEKDGTDKILDLIVKTGENNSNDTFTDAYINELDVYSNILPHFNEFAKERGVHEFESIPKCFGISKDYNFFVVILENLAPKGFRLHELSPFDMDHLKILLDAFAKWHAVSFAMNDQKPQIFQHLGKRQTKLNEFKIFETSVTSLEEQMDYLIEIYKGKEENEVLNKLRSLRSNYRNLVTEALMNTNENYLVITHSDVWNNNFLFKYNGENKPIEVKILDWQTAIVGPPMMDIAQLIFLCCVRKELEHLDDLLLFYHRSLSRRIRELGSDPDKCFPFDVCRKTFIRYAPIGIAGMPFLMRMFFSSSDPNETQDTSSGNFSAIFGGASTNTEKYFEAVNLILKFCISRDLI